MSAAAFLEPLFVMLELLRPLLPWLLLLLVVELVLLAVAFWRRPLRVGRALAVAAVLGLLVAVPAALLLPAYTHATLADLHGAVDYLVLTALGLAIAAVVALISLPALLAVLARGRARSAPRM